MGAADEVPQGEGVQISYTHARQTRVNLYERIRYTPAFSSCSWNVDDDVYSTRAEKLEGFIEMRLVLPPFSIIAVSVILMMVLRWF